MSSMEMDDRRLTEEFYEALSERAASKYKGKLHQAFVDWYVEAEFGNVKWWFTDDAGDGGLDAVVRLDGQKLPAVLIQSKFTERIGKTMLTSTAYRDFDRVVDAFRLQGEAFDEFIEGVRADARHVYRKAYDLLEDCGTWHRRKAAFRLITTARKRNRSERTSLPGTAYTYADGILELYRDYRKGQTPQAPDLQLKISDRLPYTDRQRGVTSYYFNARLTDFRSYCDRVDVSRLVARNIRYNIAGAVGKRIRSTFETNPHDFWYLHNGITVVCDRFKESKSIATLANPSVINGAQTLYAIAASVRRNSPALVATRVVVRGRRRVAQEDDEWLQGIIRGVNTQNRVKAQDFRSNEPAQIALQSRFRDERVFYERKRGEWREYRNEPRFRGFERTSLRHVGLALTAVSLSDGTGVVQVKRGAEIIFGDDKSFHRLFPSRALVGRRFTRIYFAYRLARFVTTHAYRSSRQSRVQRHAYWTIVWLVNEGMTSLNRFFSSSSVESIRQAFDDFEGKSRRGSQARKIIRKVRATVWRAWRRSRSDEPDRNSPNNFFKSKAGQKLVKRHAWRHVKSGLRQLGRECRR